MSCHNVDGNTDMNLLKATALALALVAIVAALATSGCSQPEEGGHARSDSAVRIPIALDGSPQNPAWSPDGSSIVFTRFRNGYNQGPADLVIYDFDSGTARILVSNGFDNVNLPGSAWNATTNRIVFSSSQDPHDEIFVVSTDQDRHQAVQVTDREGKASYEPSFSPDGTWVVLESHLVDVEGDGTITKYRVDKTGTYQDLTQPGEDCRQPNWSPDGRYILYQMLADGQWDIWLMNADGTDKRRITSGAGDETDASFSPDGEYVVYSADDETAKYGHLFSVPVLGGERERMTEAGGYDGAPSWSPDGEQIVFESSPGAPEGTAGTTIWTIDVEE